MLSDRYENSLKKLHELLKKLPEIETEEELEALVRDCPPDEDISALFKDCGELGRYILQLRSSGTGSSRLLESLSPQEREELKEADRVLDENRLTYHFQPIINAEDGKIFAYEALMRPLSKVCTGPYHVIKYAELNGRMDDVERSTFLNVLRILDESPEIFSGRKLFINSIPKVRLPADDLRKIGVLLMKHSDSVVVEMTEQTEVDDKALNDIKERYRNLGIHVAVDDYGTGYSNVKNLLSYMPNYVKIDRSLLADIQNSHRQRHFVREIIQFCHANDILALAEGVETSEELRTVILLGADLIQGFYTAHPSAEIIDSIPEEIVQEIKLYRQEREDGREQHIYYADCTERISLDNLSVEGIERLIIGKNGNGDVTVKGAPSDEVNVHLETVRGYTGTITLKNAWLSNIKGRPCIDIGEDCCVTLCIEGDNTLDNGGIRVPESAKLIVKGDGKLNISLDSQEYYGIGNGIGLEHGEMIFDQSGCISIVTHGKTGVAIGSGNGGILRIIQGQYKFDINGNLGLGIGALYTHSELDIHDCDISVEMTVGKGSAIGSLGSTCNVLLRRASVKLHLSGLEVTGLGTIHGEYANVDIQDASVIMNIRAERCSAVAALDGATDFRIERAGLRVTAGGDRVLAFGGSTGDTSIALITADTNVRLETKLDIRDYCSQERAVVDSGCCRLCVNGEVFYSNVESEK